MGDRLHVAKKYDVAFSDVVGFNNEIESFQRLMDLLEIYPEGEIVIENDFKIGKMDWERGIQNLKEICCCGKALSDILDRFGMTQDELISKMEMFLKESDPNNEWLVFCFY